MISERIGDLLEQEDLTHIAHQVNLYHTFGAGIARLIDLKFPRAHKMDKLTPYGDEKKLGTYSVSAGEPAIVNLYTQNGERVAGVQTNYKAMLQALEDLEADLFGRPYICRLGLPHGLGCGIAGGDWNIVSKIIDDVFAKSPVEVVICKLAKGDG